MVHTHTHAPQQRGSFGRCISESNVCDFTENNNNNVPEMQKTSEIRLDVFMYCHPQDPLGFPESLRGFEPKCSKEWPGERTSWKGCSGLGFRHSDHQSSRVYSGIQHMDRISILSRILVNQAMEKPRQMQNWGWDLMCPRSHLLGGHRTLC